MSLTADKTSVLARRVIALGQLLFDSISRESDGGRRITKEEGKVLKAEAKSVALAVLTDVVD